MPVRPLRMRQIPDPYLFIHYTALVDGKYQFGATWHRQYI